MLKTVLAVHDSVTRAGFVGGVICVALIAASYCYEVAARYFFNAPTVWANALVSYLLCATIFLAMPELTRQAAHITITVLTDRVRGGAAIVLRAGISLVSASACVLAAWFSLDATLGQYAQDIWTNPPFAVPKWTLSVVIPYAMLSSAVYFGRHAFGATKPDAVVN